MPAQPDAPTPSPDAMRRSLHCAIDRFTDEALAVLWRLVQLLGTSPPRPPPEGD